MLIVPAVHLRASWVVEVPTSNKRDGFPLGDYQTVGEDRGTKEILLPVEGQRRQQSLCHWHWLFRSFTFGGAAGSYDAKYIFTWLRHVFDIIHPSSPGTIAIVAYVCNHLYVGVVNVYGHEE